MKHIKPVNEFFGGNQEPTKTHDRFSDDEKEFIKYLYEYRFKYIMKTSEEIPSSFLGITYKKTKVDNEEEIYYNDFSVRGKHKDGILIESGKSGTFRPEGFFMGSREMDNMIKERLDVIVNLFNQSNNKELTVSRNDGCFLVSGF